jgi:hypothetical protein
MVFDWKRGAEVLTIHDPMPTAGAPMRVGCPVVDFVKWCFELTGLHRRIVTPQEIMGVKANQSKYVRTEMKQAIHDGEARF